MSKNRNLNYNDVLNKISLDVKNYLIKYNIKGLVIGVSGGLDSGINSVILSEVCKELNIPLIGRYIHIESNKEDEKYRADEIGRLFCTDYKSIDLTELYNLSLPFYEEKNVDSLSYNDKIRRGNIKARMRMIMLYNIAQENNCIVVDNDNMTEHLLGFWTLNGDVGDITPLASLYKTEVFELAKFIMNMYHNKGEAFKEEVEAINHLINAVPTDGLGITSSDIEQFGTKSYDDVDDILLSYQKVGFDINKLYDKYGEEPVNKVIKRHINSNFKRNHPHKICIDV